MQDYRLDNIDKRSWSYDDIDYWVNPKDDTCNATIIYDNKKSRLRAGIIILDGDKILLGEEADEPGVFSLPGGGLEFGETPVEAAVREAQEEVYINVKNPIDTKFDYCECHEKVKDWVRDNVPEDEWWYNYYTCLIIGTYDSDYEGKVDAADKDKAMKSSAKWYKISEVIDDPSFKSQWKKAIKTYKKLNEDTRNQLIAKSRSAGIYKDTSRGKNRFERKKYSKIATQVQSYNKIDMNAFFKQDILEVTIPVTGETDSYDVVIKLEGVLVEIQRNIKANSNKFEYRTVVQAVTKVFNTTNVYTKCSCADFKYRFDHWSIINNWGANDSAHDPGPGKGIANPKNDKGNGCKHILLVLNNADWIMKVSSCIKNYITYAENHMKPAFLKLIFPKLYGIDSAEAVDENLVPPDFNFNTSKDIIEDINKWARDRGKFKAGTNVNPVTGTGGKARKTPTEEKS